MLLSLNIHNIALITDCELALGKGLNILSGETGAGKSIIIDSLTFVLGERADKSLIRSGESSASVQAIFYAGGNNAIEQCLKDMDIEPDDTLILKRTMTIEGRNECRINGRTVTLSMLKKLTGHLADIYGQHEHQSLLLVASHMELLDAYGRHGGLRAAVLAKYEDLRNLLKSMETLGDEAEIRRRIDTVKYQIDELNSADVKAGEEDALTIERAKFMSAEKISSGVSGAYNAISGGGDGFSAYTALNTARVLLNSVSQFDSELKELSARLESAAIELKDVASTLNSYLENFDFDEKRADKVEKRLSDIKLLKKKYGPDIPDYLAKIKLEYDSLCNATDAVENLNAEIDKARKALLAECEKLSAARKKTAIMLEIGIIKELNDLGMSGTTFKADIKSDPFTANETGFDRIEFLISPNRGEPLKELSKIISGGEMSRFMLAIKNISAELDTIDCMVFDEIDSGISGHIAQVVAEKLTNISVKRQVIAVTHLPQLASMADSHYLIAKYVKGGKTVTEITLLDEEDSCREVARLIGGSDYSGHALPHAAEMKAHGKKYKLAL